MLGCWWLIPIREPSPFSPACLSVATDRLDELWCPVLFCNPLEPVCLQPPPLYTHAQANKDTSSLILWVQKQHLFSFSVSLPLCLVCLLALGIDRIHNKRVVLCGPIQPQTFLEPCSEGLDNIDLAWALNLASWISLLQVHICCHLQYCKSSLTYRSWKTQDFSVSNLTISTCSSHHTNTAPPSSVRS